MTPPSHMTSGYVASDGADIYFESAGSGPALVFIHAGVADRRMWDAQFETFAPRFRVVRYDHRGFGKSAMPDGSYALRRDLQSVLVHLGIEKAALVGCSMGGATAIDYTLEHPERVTALVAVGSGVSGWSEWTDEAIRYWTEFMRLAKSGEVDRAREMDAHLWIDGTREPSNVDPVYRARALELHRENFTFDRLQHPEEEMKPPAIGRLGEIKCPTMVVIGDSDTPELVRLANRIANGIPGAHHVTIENAAHLPSLEHPEEFNRLLMDFLKPIFGVS
jgi:pimeloyl-ACP methyl ester carboxylesterase